MEEPVGHPDDEDSSHLSHEKNPQILSIESWLINRDPYFMVGPYRYLDSIIP